MTLELEWVERLLGGLVLPSDPARESPVSLVLRCTGSLRALRAGRADVVGTLRAPGFVSITSLVGDVRVTPAGVRYALALTDDAGRPIEIVLERRGLRRDAYAALTTMTGRARDATGAVVADLRLRVDVRGGALLEGLRIRG